MPIDTIEGICNMALGFAGANRAIDDINGTSVTAKTCLVYFEQYRDDLLTEYDWPFARREVQLNPLAGNTYSQLTSYNLGDMVQYGSFVYQSLQNGNVGNLPPGALAWWRQITRTGWGYAALIPADVLVVRALNEAPAVNANSGVGSRGFNADKKAAFRIEDANDGSGMKILLTDFDVPVISYTSRIIDPRQFPTNFIMALAWKLAPPLCLALRVDTAAAEKLEMKAQLEISKAVTKALRTEREDPEPPSEFEVARG